MSGIIDTSDANVLIRTNIWNDLLKERMKDKLIAQNFVSVVDFPDGNTLNIPSIGQFVAQKDYVDGNQVEFSSPDFGNFTMSITESEAVGFAIPDSLKEDTYYAQQAIAKFMAEAERSLEETVEESILKIVDDAQTSGDLNSINGAAHRFVGSGSNGTLTTKDLRRAKYALVKANVPQSNLVAIVDPSCVESLRVDSDISAIIQNTPLWSNLVSKGFSNEMNFVGTWENIDIYMSNRLPSVTSETIDGSTVTNGVSNVIFSADPSVEALLFAWRRMPTMEYQRNSNAKTDYYSGTQRYGTALYREAAAVSILTNTGSVF